MAPPMRQKPLEDPGRRFGVPCMCHLPPTPPLERPSRSVAVLLRVLTDSASLGPAMRNYSIDSGTP
eukprot:12450943-Alexandrium_andersonii.AAC.1